MMNINTDPVAVTNSPNALNQNSQRVQKEHEVKVASVFKRIASSYLFWAVASVAAIGIGTMVALTIPVGFPVLAISGVALLCLLGVAAVVAKNRKRFLYEVSLPIGYILYKINPTKYPIYSKITDDLYLGRIPLKNNNDHNSLLKEGIGAVVSVVEKFENHTLGLFSDPVTPDDWKSLGVEHIQIESPDYFPLTNESFAKALEFIDAKHAQGKKVYVHCKAGRGRSAAVVVANLVSNQTEKCASVTEGVALVKERRPIISLREKKVNSIKAFLGLNS